MSGDVERNLELRKFAPIYLDIGIASAPAQRVYAIYAILVAVVLPLVERNIGTRAPVHPREFNARAHVSLKEH